VKSREGYQNFVPLDYPDEITHRTKKAKDTSSEDDLASLHAGLICLTGGEEGTVYPAALSSGGIAQGQRSACGNCAICSDAKCIRPNCSGTSVGKKKRAIKRQLEDSAKIVFAATGYKWRLPCASGLSANCWMCLPAFGIITLLATAGQLLSRNFGAAT